MKKKDHLRNQTQILISNTESGATSKSLILYAHCSLLSQALRNRLKPGGILIKVEGVGRGCLRRLTWVLISNTGLGLESKDLVLIGRRLGVVASISVRRAIDVKSSTEEQVLGISKEVLRRRQIPKEACRRWTIDDF